MPGGEAGGAHRLVEGGQEAVFAFAQGRQLLGAFPEARGKTGQVGGAVDSVQAGRRRVQRSMSHWNCMRKSLAAAPPSTFSTESGMRASSAMARAKSHTW